MKTEFFDPLGKPDHYWLRHFANYLNTEPKDSSLYEKARASFAFLANRIALKRKAECDAARQYAKLKVASETVSN
jgi:hypothetical protein